MNIRTTLAAAVLCLAAQPSFAAVPPAELWVAVPGQQNADPAVFVNIATLERRDRFSEGWVMFVPRAGGPVNPVRTEVDCINRRAVANKAPLPVRGDQAGLFRIFCDAAYAASLSTFATENDVVAAVRGRR